MRNSVRAALAVVGMIAAVLGACSSGEATTHGGVGGGSAEAFGGAGGYGTSGTDGTGGADSTCVAIHVGNCSSSEDCDDGDPCTADECMVHHCRHVDVRECGAPCTNAMICMDATTATPCCRRGTPGSCMPSIHACVYCIDTDCYKMD